VTNKAVMEFLFQAAYSTSFSCSAHISDDRVLNDMIS